MSTANDCSHRAQCIVDLLARRKEERKSTAWTALLSQGQDLCNENKATQARQRYDQAIELSDNLAAVDDKDSNRLKATALTCIGAMHLCCKEAESATTRFLDSAKIFEQDGDKYGHAVALFALAQTHELREQWSEAFRCYELSQHVLSHLNSDSSTIYLRQQVEQRRGEAIRHRDNLPKTSAPVWGMLGFLAVFDSMPAGDPRSLPERVIGYIETDRLIINDKPYYVANGDSPTVRLTFSPLITYIAFPIKGDSMNNAGIDDGDYVILRTNSAPGSEPVPENGEIVAVTLPEETATLKRFHKRGIQVSFEPDSKNPNHKSYRFDKINDDFPGKIIGIHVATLKPQ